MGGGSNNSNMAEALLSPQVAVMVALSGATVAAAGLEELQVTGYVVLTGVRVAVSFLTLSGVDAECVGVQGEGGGLDHSLQGEALPEGGVYHAGEDDRYLGPADGGAVVGIGRGDLVGRGIVHIGLILGRGGGEGVTRALIGGMEAAGDGHGLADGEVAAHIEDPPCCAPCIRPYS